MALSASSTYADALAQYKNSARWWTDATGQTATDFAEACMHLAQTAGKAMQSESGGKTQMDYTEEAKEAREFAKSVATSAPASSIAFSQSGPR